MKSIFLLLAVLFFAFNASADPKEFLYLKHNQEKVFNKLTWQRIFMSQPAISSNAITQTLDHNNSADKRTFQQRYWVDSSHASGKNAPVLLYICGEGECGDYAAFSLSEQASKLHAHIFALEHRYYGKSQPFADLRTENLLYLTIDQALKDLVSFKQAMQSEYQLSGKWILVGGSYAGALAGYGRAVYPNQFAGALASSGPVQADLDFSEYDHYVAKVEGATCLSAVQKAVTEIEGLVQDENTFASVKAEFNASKLKDKDDFLYLVADTGAAAVQYGMRERFCQLVETQGRAGYAKAAEMVSSLFGNMADMSAQAAEDISLAANDGAVGMRQWFYQSCTEFGFWQNAWPAPAESARSQRINASYHARLCKRLFNFDSAAAVEHTNQTYYGPILDFKTSNILFTNGSEDPWMNLSIADVNQNHENKNIDAFTIEGGAHCDDLGMKSSSAVRQARDLFLSLANKWLGQKK